MILDWKSDEMEERLMMHQQAARKWRLRSEQLDRRTSPSGIEPGVSGIWVTCERGREAGCVSQLYELFNEVRW